MVLKEKKLIEFINFTKLDSNVLKEILVHRNSDRIRKNMVSTELISEESHLNFCHNLKKDKNNLYFLVRDEQELIGVVDFKNIDHIRHTYEPGGYCISHNSDFPNLWGYVLSASTFICLKFKLYFPKILVKKDNHQALLFNTMKMGCILTDEDNEYYYLSNNYLDPKVNSEDKILGDLSYLTNIFDLRFDL